MTCCPRRQQCPRQRKRQRKHGVLELDHFKHRADAGLFFLRHLFYADKLSLAAALRQVKRRETRLPMIEFASVELYESNGIAENSGIRGGRETLSWHGR